MNSCLFWLLRAMTNYCDSTLIPLIRIKSQPEIGLGTVIVLSYVPNICDKSLYMYFTKIQYVIGCHAQFVVECVLFRTQLRCIEVNFFRNVVVAE